VNAGLWVGSRGAGQPRPVTDARRTPSPYTPVAMTKTLRAPMALGAVFFALTVGLAACGGNSVSEGDVVNVDGTTTAEATFDRWLQIAGKSAGGQTGAQIVIPDPPNFTKCIADRKATLPKPVKGQPKPTEAQLKASCKQQYDTLKGQVMSFLIRAQWLDSEAERQGLDISDEDVKKSFDQARRQAFPSNEQFAAFLKSSGQTQADLLFRQRTQLIEQKITEKLTKGTTEVSQKEITEYYNENKKEQFTQPATADVLVVLTKTEEQAEKAKKALESGTPFEDVVKQYSTDPTTKQKGGELTNVTQGQGEKAFDDAVFSAKKGVVTGPVKTSEGYYVFKVTRSTPGKTQPLDNQLRASIKQIIVSENQREALEKFGNEYQDRWRGKTECAKGFVVPDCANSKSKPASTVPPGAVPQQQEQPDTPPAQGQPPVQTTPAG
jgi:foldase protein PrsA